MVDAIGAGAMKTADSEVAGSMPTWQRGGGGLVLGITGIAQPAGPAVTTVAGAFVTPVEFAAGTVFGMRGVFAGVAAPHETDDVWAVTIVTRTGNERHLPSETLAAATLQVRGDGARLCQREDRRREAGTAGTDVREWALCWRMRPVLYPLRSPCPGPRSVHAQLDRFLGNIRKC